MSRTVWGDIFDSGELANTSMFCTVTPDSSLSNESFILRAIRTWVVVYNDPTFTNLTAKLYNNDENASTDSPGSLIASSTTVLTKSQIHTLDNAYKSLYFEFDDITLVGNSKYHIVLNGDGYVPSSSSYLAWMKAWPKPVYDYSQTYEKLLVSPYQIVLFGAEL